MKLKAGKLTSPGFLLATVIGLGFSIYSYFFLLTPQNPFFWDESHHAEFAFYIRNTLTAGNWSDFFRLANSLILWPPLHSVIGGVFISICGATMTAARLSSLIFLLPSAWLLYLISREVFPESGNPTGVIAVLFFCSSPLILFISATCMIEMPAVFLTLLLFLIYFKALKSGKKLLYFLSGILIALLFLTKYNYGLLLAFSLGLEGCFRFFLAERNRRSVVLKEFGALFGAFCLCLGLWFAAGNTQAKWSILQYYLESGRGQRFIKLGIFDRILFYIRSLANIYTFSFWIFLSFIGGITVAGARLRESKIRSLLITVLVFLLVCTIGGNQQDRYFIIAFPLVALLGAGFVVQVFGKIKKRSWRRAALLIAAVALSLDLIGFPSYCRQVANHTAFSFRFPASRKISYSLLAFPMLYPSILKQPFNHLNPEADYLKPTHTFDDVWEFIYKTTKGRGPLCCLSSFQEFSPHLQRWYSTVSNLPIVSNWDPRSAFFAYVEVNPDSPYYIKEYPSSFLPKNQKWIDYLRRLEENNFLKVAGARLFPDISLSVKVFEKTMKFGVRRAK